MDRAHLSGTAGTPPSAPVSPSIGYPTDGSPLGPVPATEPGAWWFHMMTEEVRKVIVDAGLTPDHEDLSQLSLAVQTLAAAMASSAATTGEISAFSAVDKFIRPDRLESAFAKSIAANGYVKLPGGLIVQWGTYSEVGTPLAPGGNLLRSQALPIAFPNAGLQVVGSSSLHYVHCGSAFSSTSQLSHRFSSNHSGSVNLDISWFAIGH